MKPPRVPESALPVLRDADMTKLLATCERGQSFEDRRDAAILRVFMDTGARDKTKDMTPCYQLPRPLVARSARLGPDALGDSRRAVIRCTAS